MTYGATDEFGYNVVEDGVHVHDFNATILHLMGIWVASSPNLISFQSEKPHESSLALRLWNPATCTVQCCSFAGRCRTRSDGNRVDDV